MWNRLPITGTLNLQCRIESLQNEKTITINAKLDLKYEVYAYEIHFLNEIIIVCKTWIRQKKQVNKVNKGLNLLDDRFACCQSQSYLLESGRYLYLLMLQFVIRLSEEKSPREVSDALNSGGSVESILHNLFLSTSETPPIHLPSSDLNVSQLLVLCSGNIRLNGVDMVWHLKITI